jgi:hypothetical protein
MLTPTAFGLFAQSGSIKGVVKDVISGEGVIGANVIVIGTSQGAVADLTGAFEIPKVKAGTYNVVVSFISYRADTLKGITVYPDQTTVINTDLREEGQELNEVVITGAKVTNTDVSVITELRKNDLVAVGISAQQISMSQDRDAAQIMKRIPGITIVNNRFVNVRGLSERYSTVMLNGIIAPSSEVDSKAFAFDLIPSNLIDRMLVYKSGEASKPGEFAGAVIDIQTKSSVEENAIALSVSGSLRSGTTGKTVFLGEQTTATDWLGGNGGSRNLPSSFPSVKLTELPQSEQGVNDLNRATKLLPNTWGLRSINASPDYRVNLDITRTIHLGAYKLDNITSLSYAHTNQYYKSSQNYYQGFSVQDQKSTPKFLYNDERFTQTNRLGAISNFTLTISPSHRVEFKNFYNQQGQNQTTLRTGQDGVNSDVNNMAINYFARSIYTGQLLGKHNFSDAVTINWIFGYSSVLANQPDYKKISTQRAIGSTDAYQIVIPPSSSSTDASRFYSKLNEQTFSAAGNVDIKLNPEVEEEKITKLTAGYYLEQKDRDFNARWMAYNWNVNATTDNEFLRATSFDKVFAPENLVTKFILNEGTNVGNGGTNLKDPGNFDKYKGHNTLLAGYAGIVTPVGQKFRLSAGMRVENNLQRIDVLNLSGINLEVTHNNVLVPMPFGNLSYNITDKMLVRAAYSKTVNRPVFRELAPFQFYDFDKNADIIGNFNLATAKIDNIDLRWELYPSKAENISIGAFYKHFKNPIEQVIGKGSNLIYTYANALSADNYGVEAEVRKSFDQLSSSFLNKLTVVLNGALIKSTIKLPAALDNLASNRALQGQSPYIANASVYYNNYENGLQVSVQYNVFGKRIYAVGDKDQNANQYQMARHQVDLTIAKQLTKHFELKFGIQDVLNQKYKIMQDSNYDKKITHVDEPIQVYKLGQYSTLGITWKL